MQYSSFVFYRDHARTLSAAMAVLGVPPLQFESDVQPASASFVTPNYFAELGTPAAYGRLFDPALDSKPDAEPAVAAFVVVILRLKLVAKRPVKVRCAPGRAKYSSGPLAKERIAEGFLPQYAFAEAYCGSADLREGKS